MFTTMPQRYLLHAALLLAMSSAAFACHGQLLVSGLSPGEKDIILHEHNKLRQLVATGRYPGQPGAQNMREIVWDDELAARAQQWADNCQFRHDPLRTINRFTMGQNLAIIWSTAPLDPTDGDFPSRIQSWFNEVQKYSFGSSWSPQTGHYSQLVWGETSLVGCGFSEYKDSTKYNKLYVCNYGPGGNVVGFNPYQVGKPSCGSYGLRTSSRYQGLCAPSAAPVVGINSNAIDTYEYTNQNNNKQTAYSSTQPASSSSPTYSKQAPSYTATKPFGATSTSSSTAGVSYNGGHTTYSTQTSYRYKYKNKLEAYRPSPAEFQKSIRKHTILRTYLGTTDQNQQQQQQQQQDQEQNTDIEETVPEVYVFEESKEQPQTTKKPANRGWSLLTWRG